jgi:hypothetical protein
MEGLRQLDESNRDGDKASDPAQGEDDVLLDS